MQPSVGRIVHYVSYGTPPRADGSQAFASEPRAAIVTAVRDGESMQADLCVLNPTGMFFNLGVAYDESDEPAGGTWHWPPRV